MLLKMYEEIIIKLPQKKLKLIKLIIIGAGGFGSEVLETINDCNKKKKRFKVYGFIDENKSLIDKNILGVPILGNIKYLLSLKVRDYECLITVADPVLRKKIVEKLNNKVDFCRVIHPSVIYSSFTKIGKGCIIQPGNILMPNTRLGNHVIINMHCTVGHNSYLKNFVSMMPGVHIGGNNTINEGVYVGSGTITNEKINVGKWSVIGSGSVIIKHIPDNSLVIGIPGKIKRKIKSLNDRPQL